MTPQSGNTTQVLTFPIIDRQGHLIPAERRLGERREWSRNPGFPNIPQNRRRTVDRRNLNVRVIPEPVLPKIALRLADRLFEITEDGMALTVGRAEECDIVIDEPWVSRHHGCIICEGDRFLVTDDSRNGTSVRTGKNTPHILHGGEYRLEGSGTLRFGADVTREDADDILRFSVIRDL